ncbi:MAG: hypothetical protein GXO91_06255 [FCB group bacterium]|nr:hypothetical protein [FCB group bacterium]
MIRVLVLLILISVIFCEEQIVSLVGIEDGYEANHFAFTVIPENDAILPLVQPLIDQGVFRMLFSGEDSLFVSDDGEIIDEIQRAQFFRAYTMVVNDNVVWTITGDTFTGSGSIDLTYGLFEFGYSYYGPISPEEIFHSVYTENALQIVEDAYGHFFIPDMNVDTIVCLVPGQVYQMFILDDVEFYFSFAPCDSCYLDMYGGDANYDYIVDVLDIVFVVSGILDEIDFPYFVECIVDLNSDDEIDIFDVLAMVEIIMGY